MAIVMVIMQLFHKNNQNEKNNFYGLDCVFQVYLSIEGSCQVLSL